MTVGFSHILIVSSCMTDYDCNKRDNKSGIASHVLKLKIRGNIEICECKVLTKLRKWK